MQIQLPLQEVAGDVILQILLAAALFIYLLSQDIQAGLLHFIDLFEA